MAAAEPLVSLRKLSYFYPKSSDPALLNLDLEIGRGEILGVIGATGSGKTTLCLALNGIVPQFFGGRFFGEAIVAGLDTVSQPIHTLSRRVGMVFEEPSTQLIASTVENEIAFALENLKTPPAEIRARIAAALKTVHLEDYAQKHPHELSGGQQQRLALAAAFALQPELIVLDEPTSQLDPQSTSEMFRLIRKINRSRGTTFVISGHAAEEMAEYTDRIALLSRGSLLALGASEEIYGTTGLLEQERLRTTEVAATFQLLSQRGMGPAKLPVRLDDGLSALALLPKANRFDPEPLILEKQATPILEARRLTFAYPNGTKAIRDISIRIDRGDYVLLIGQNGAGKSTLIKHFLNLLEPSEGEVWCEGISIAKRSVAELAQRIGYVPQNPDRQIFNSSVEKEVAFSLSNKDLSQEEKDRRIAEVLEVLDLTAQRHAHPFALSKGDRARVVIAAILVLDPEILIFDEPTTGQDYRGALAILDLTKRLHARGKTIVVVTHHLYLMPEYARRAVVMGSGTVLFDGTLREVYHNLSVLQQSSLKPTQAVLLAQAAHPENRSLTPAELASTFPADGKPQP
jgi:energy-coupling factor transport system ATP-binding protein